MDPYYPASINKHTSPQLDEAATSLYSDTKAQVAAASARALFCSQRQALLHGDLHTGSVMVTTSATFAIDSEFAFYGPMAFDIGKVIGEFLLTYFALDGHSTPTNPRQPQQDWLLQVPYRNCRYGVVRSCMYSIFRASYAAWILRSRRWT